MLTKKYLNRNKYTVVIKLVNIKTSDNRMMLTKQKLHNKYINIWISAFVCVCVCVCVFWHNDVLKDRGRQGFQNRNVNRVQCGGTGRLRGHSVFLYLSLLCKYSWSLNTHMSIYLSLHVVADKYNILGTCMKAINQTRSQLPSPNSYITYSPKLNLLSLLWLKLNVKNEQ